MSITLQDVATSAAPDTEQAAENRLSKFAARVADSNTLSSLLAVFDQGMISGTNFLTAVVIGRCCGAETLGVYSLIASAIAMLMGVQEQLITAPYVMYHNRKRGLSLKRYSGSILIHQIVFTVLVFAAMLVLVLTGQATSSIFSTVAMTMLFVLPAALFRAFVREVALAHCKVLTVVLIDAAVCATQLVALVALFLLMPSTFPPCMSSGGAAAAILVSAVIGAAARFGIYQRMILSARQSSKNEIT